MSIVHRDVTSTTLKDRGWTQQMIVKFMPNPDTTATNPHYKSGPPMRLYSVDRILKIEASDEWKKEAEKSAKRKLSAAKAIETKRKQLEAWTESLVFDVPIIDSSALRIAAINHFNSRSRSGIAILQSDDGFLDRICVNYLRHELSDYDGKLLETRKKIGQSDAYEIIRDKVLNAIADAYPYLASECNTQLQRSFENQLDLMK